MILEAVAFLGIIIIVLFVFADYFKKRELGLIASLLLLILGIWILMDGIQIITGTTTTTITGLICGGLPT